MRRTFFKPVMKSTYCKRFLLGLCIGISGLQVLELLYSINRKWELNLSLNMAGWNGAYASFVGGQQEVILILHRWQPPRTLQFWRSDRRSETPDPRFTGKWIEVESHNHNGPGWTCKGVHLKISRILLLAAFGLFPLATAVVWMVRRRVLSEPEHCNRCGYWLRGIESPRCPECGEVLAREGNRGNE